MKPYCYAAHVVGYRSQGGGWGGGCALCLIQETVTVRLVLRHINESNVFQNSWGKTLPSESQMQVKTPVI